MIILNRILRFLKYWLIKTGNLAPRIHQHNGINTVSILMYHGVTERALEVADWCFIKACDFEDQIKYIKNNFHVVHLSDAFKQNGNKYKKPIAVITFDDGFYNNYAIAYPILEKYQVPATIFLTTGLLNTEETLWYCNLNLAISSSRKTEFTWENNIFDISDNKNKSKSIAKLKKLLKLKTVAEMNKSLVEIYRILEYFPIPPIPRDSPFRMLDYDAIHEMNKSPLINFGAHTVTHTILTKIPEDESKFEIKKSIEDVNTITKKKYQTFAYPNGLPEDFDSFHIKQLQQNNIELAVTTTEGINHFNADLYRLKRVGVGNDTSMDEFIVRAHGCYC